MLQDKDQRVIPAVLTALAATGSARRRAALTDRLNSEDAVVRMAAANGLARSRRPAARRRWPRRLAASQNDTHLRRARGAARRARRSRPGRRRSRCSTAALTDADWAVRVRAAALLQGPRSDRRAAPAHARAGAARAGARRPRGAAHAGRSRRTAYIDTEGDDPDRAGGARRAADGRELRRRWRARASSTACRSTASCRTSSCRTAIRAATAKAVRATRSATRSTSGPTCAARSAWRSTGRDTGGSQFFITHSPQPHLDAPLHRVRPGGGGHGRRRSAGAVGSDRTVRVWDGVDTGSAATSSRRGGGSFEFAGTKKGGAASAPLRSSGEASYRFFAFLRPSSWPPSLPSSPLV